VFSKEENRSILVDTSSRTVREHYAQQARLRQQALEQSFRKSGVDFARIATGDDYVKPLLGLFRAKGARR
jgi:hypothetical protein